MTRDTVVVGIDVAKNWLDVAVLQTEERFRIDNDRQGWTRFDPAAQGPQGPGDRHRAKWWI